MMLRYEPGTVYVVARRGCIVLLPDGGHELVRGLWDRLDDDVAILELLQAITGASGSDLRALPPFAILTRVGARVNVLVRGDLRVVVERADGEGVEIDGQDVSTWSERGIDDALWAVATTAQRPVTAPRGDAGRGGLPLSSGIVLAGTVSWSVATDAESDTASRVLGAGAARVAEPEPASVGVGADAATPFDELFARIDMGASSPGVLADALQEDDYAHLWGSTQLRTVEDAAVRNAEETPQDVTLAPINTDDIDTEATAVLTGMIVDVPIPTVAGDLFGEQGHAVSGYRVRGHAEPEREAGVGYLESSFDDLVPYGMLVEGIGLPAAEPGPAAGETTGPQVLARACTHGHANSPSRELCAVCGAPLTADVALMPRPSLGRLFVSTGQVVDLDRTVVVGRRPRSTRSATDVARLVTVPSTQQDISRSHLEITLEGWHVLLSDLNTTNGTTLLRPGQAPRRLDPGEPTLIADGDTIDMGDSVSLTFAGLQ